MPNRILRTGINSSDRVDALSPIAEVFYRRLMSYGDDYGRAEADARVLRANLYPKKGESITLEHIETCLKECTQIIEGEDEPLVYVYTVGRKRYLEISNFGQRIRSDSKFPGRPSEESLNGGPNGTSPAGYRKEKGEGDLLTDDGHARTFAARASTPTPPPTPPPTPQERGRGENQPPPPDKRQDLESRAEFESLVADYPAAGRERLERARTTLREVLREELATGKSTRIELLAEIRAGLERWKLSERWNDGKVHLLGNWVKERLWREHPVAVTESKRNRAGSERVSRREQGTADFRRLLARELAERPR